MKNETKTDLATVGVLLSLMLMVGHLEWWDPSAGRELNPWLMVFLFLVFLICGAVVESDLEDDEKGDNK